MPFVCCIALGGELLVTVPERLRERLIILPFVSRVYFLFLFARFVFTPFIYFAFFLSNSRKPISDFRLESLRVIAIVT